MPISDVVNLSITLATKTASQAGFGEPIFLGYTTNIVQRAKRYTALADMVTDGFATTEPLYVAAQKFLSQNPNPGGWYIGRTALDNARAVTITPVAINSTDYTITINGTAFTFTSDATATVAEICTGLVALINAGSEPVTATDNTTDIGLLADNSGESFTLDIDVENVPRPFEYMQIEDTTADGGIATDFAAILAENSDWYAVVPTQASKAVLVALAAAVEAQRKIMIAGSADYNVQDSGSSTDVATTLQTASYARTAILFSPEATASYPAAAWCGRCLGYDPGSITWANWDLSGVTYDDLTAAQVTTLEGKGANFYYVLADLGATRHGNVADGEFIDVIRGTDWLYDRITTAIWTVIQQSEKIPYTDKGVSTVVGALQGVLREAVRKDVLAADPEPEVDAPLVADVSTANRSNRILPDVEFTGTLAGAIHKVTISGTISV